MTPATRRRGSVLEQAIFEAAFEQLHEVGYAKFTMEGVATAAQTGKAALYRRWSSKEDLIRDAFLHVLPSPDDIGWHDTVREDLLALMNCYVTAVNVTQGTAFQVLKAETEVRAGSTGVLHSVVKEKVTQPLRERIYQALRRAADRGEIRPEAATQDIARVGPALVVYRSIEQGYGRLSDDFATKIVDDVLIPLLRP